MNNRRSECDWNNTDAENKPDKGTEPIDTLLTAHLIERASFFFLMRHLCLAYN